MPIVSVIVPVYNTAEYLERCLDSLIEQTLEEIEILVVNDGSTDHSQEIIDDFARKSSKIIPLTKTNGGLSAARNFGIELAKGDFFAFVDSDDWVENDMMEHLYNLSQKHNAEMVICNLQKVDENGLPFRKLTQIKHLPEKIDLQKDFSLFGESASFACNKLFRKELWKEIRFPNSMYFEDIATIPRLVLKCKCIAKTDRVFYHYFERRESMSRSYNERGLDILKAVEMVKKDFENSDFSHEKEQWKRFFLYHSFFSFLAYWAFVKDKKIKKEMNDALQIQLKNEKISFWDKLFYKREGENYLLSLAPKKIVFYLIYLVFPKLLS